MEIHNRTPNVYDLLEINKILLSTSNNGESFEKDLHLNGFIENHGDMSIEFIVILFLMYGAFIYQRINPLQCIVIY